MRENSIEIGGEKRHVKDFIMIYLKALENINSYSF
jgi:hypothetical protein